MKAETPYIETEVLLAVMNENEGDATQLLTTLGIRSLIEFRSHLTSARLLVDEVLREKRKEETQ